MNVDDFDYDLPEAAIAQEPRTPRDAARLLVASADGGVRHRRFRDLPEILAEGDLVVLNDTRVRPYRVEARRPTGGRVDVLLLEPAANGAWWALLRSSRGPRAGEVLEAAEGVRLEVLGREEGRFLLRPGAEGGDPLDRIERIGRMPLPPYIRRAPDDPRDAADRERYQTVYAREPGAVAAPTAGLHVTRELLDRLRERRIDVAHLTLHVGAGTFRPVRVRRVEDHRMHAESFDLPEATADAVARVRERGGRVVAVGTTVVRTLESRADDDGRVRPGRGECDLFLVPGSRFRVVDAMVTNFHLPRSTLLMLVAAYVGRERILELYRLALDLGYRFYSYGDAMLLEGRR